MEALTRGWNGTPREQALIWCLRKAGHEARCSLWSHPLGWELRVTLDGELLRGEAYRSEAQVLSNVEAWRRQFEEKGWSAPMA